MSSPVPRQAVEAPDPYAGSPGDPRYTFGIELEMLYPVIRKHPSGLMRLDPMPRDPRWFSNGLEPCSFKDQARPFADALNAAGLFSVVAHREPHEETWYHAGRSHDIKTEAARRDVQLISEYPLAAQCWLVQRDNSLTKVHVPRGWNGYDGVRGLEISSPVLRANKKGYEEVFTALLNLRQTFRLLTDPSCGLHVHLGLGNRPTPMPTIRKFTALMWLADPLLSKTIHWSRLWTVSPGLPLHVGAKLARTSNQALSPVRETEDLNRYFPQHMQGTGQAIDERLRLELSHIFARNLRDISESLHLEDSIRCGVSLRNLEMRGPCGDCIEGTIEVRLREGTLDPMLVIRWVRLLVGMLRVSDQGPENKYHRLVVNLAKNPTGDENDTAERLRRFLTELDLQQDFGFWSSVMAKHADTEAQQRESTEAVFEKMVNSLADDNLCASSLNYGSEMKVHNLQYCAVLPKLTAQEHAEVRKILDGVAGSGS